MGSYVMLPLYGVARETRGFATQRPWQVLRLQAANTVPAHEADTALVRDPEEATIAKARGFVAAFAIGDDLNIGSDTPANLIVAPSRFAYLSEGDVLGFQPANRRFRTLYRRSSQHNSFLVTERCNHYCLMCSQPPRDVDDQWLLDEIEAAIELVHPATQSFTFTGGEPLLEWRKFIKLLGLCRDALPNTAVHVLTNGRGFANSEITKAWASVRHTNLMAGIPIYSAVDHVHDYVVQAQGAFNETVLGVLKLKDQDQRVEVRVVLHAVTAPRIVETCRWLARNLPFVDHVALMGLENTGFTLANSDLLWIDPVDYRDALAEAVQLLASAKVPVSVYNLPRCVLARPIWPYALRSISDWKNGYAEVCSECIEQPRCAGFFTSGRPKQSRGISPILA
jgi:His-Xaa-Ser system radical SAM maturase HxsC